ncbi:S-layer homology domain-containing protein [Domibacillus sp. 8LH]|uniref:S-layer homology domain-containing protein n=1 Tax=Domibacillus sp. 8LH TaxID=3073900 RepID=UPI00317F6281
MKKPFNVLATALVAGTVFSSSIPSAFAEESQDDIVPEIPVYSDPIEEDKTDTGVGLSSFTDANGTIYQDAVRFLELNAIAKGLNETTFGVNEPIKRVDVAMILGTFTEINAMYPNAPKAGFRDLPTRAVKTVSTLKYRGIINGKSNTYFGAGLNITRGEAALMLYNAFKDDFYPSEGMKLPFTDVQTRYEEAIRTLYGAGIIKGTAGKFGTDNNITRGQLALMIYRIDKYHLWLREEEKSGFVAFGDSNTEGLYYEKQFPEYLDEQWTDQVAAVYGGGLEESEYNAGITGDQTEEGLARFKEEVLDVKPEYVTIMFGINDALLYKGQPQISKEEFRNNLVYMLYQLRLRGIKPVLMTNTPVIESIYYDLQLDNGYNIKPMYADKGGLRNWIDSYNDIIREVAIKNAVKLVDVNKLLTEKAGGSTDATLLKSELIETKTGIHMTPKANDIVAEAVKDALSKATY